MASDVDLYSYLISTILFLLCFFILEVHPLQYPVIFVENSNIMHIERELINRILLNCCLSGFLGSFSSRRDVKWDCCRFRSTNGLVRFRWSPASLLIRLGGKFRGYIYSINFFLLFQICFLDISEFCL